MYEPLIILGFNALINAYNRNVTDEYVHTVFAAVFEGTVSKYHGGIHASSGFARYNDDNGTIS